MFLRKLGCRGRMMGEVGDDGLFGGWGIEALVYYYDG